MKFTTANVAILMVAVVGISAASTFAFTTEVADYGKPSATIGAMMLTGNVKVTQIDGDGNTIALRQSSNHIVGQGMEMIISQVFNDMNQSAAFPLNADAASSPVSHMEIGHKGEWELLMNDTDLRQTADFTIGSCIRKEASFANVTGPAGNGFGGLSLVQGAFGINGGHIYCQQANWLANERGGPASADCSAQANVTAQAQFFGADCSGALTIDEAGMFNDLAAGTMFARNNFGGVVLNPPDTLQLDWEFTFTDS